MRCRTSFTTFNRKHHCRNCGQTFCNACSSKTVALPHLGIVDSVRVCDGCFSKLSNPAPAQKKDDGYGSRTTSSANVGSGATSSREDELARKEREELEKAIAASLETAKKSPPSSSYSAPVHKPEPKPQPKRQHNDDDDEDLRKAIEASLKDLNVSDYTSSSNSASAYPVAGGYTGDRYGGVAREEREERREAVTPSVNVNELSTVELENIRMFSELVERTEADVASRGLGGLNATGLQVGFWFLHLSHS